MTDAALPAPPYADIFVGDSDMARLMREHDWASTSLGPPEHWPATLRVALRILLTSRFDMWLGWGPDALFFYNDAYRPTLGTKHPASLARPTREIWSEIWDEIKGRISTVYDQGQATRDNALLLVMHRSGYPEETYHTFSYSPLIDDDGTVGGLFCVVSEDTNRIISERRLKSLRELASGISISNSRKALITTVCEALDNTTRDLPFSMLYMFDEEGGARLVCASGIDEDHRLAPTYITAGDAMPWALDGLGADKPVVIVSADGGADVPRGLWDQASASWLALALIGTGSNRPTGFLIGAMNPYLPLTDEYVSFVELMAGQIVAAFDHVTALETRTAERDRLRELFHQAPSFICVVSGPQHRFELANQSYNQLVGFDNVEGRLVRDVLPSTGNQPIFELLDEVYRSGEPYVGHSVTVMLRPTARAPRAKVCVDFVFQPIKNAAGAVTGIFAEGYDVSAKVAAQAGLQRANDTLEARIRERTSDLEAALARLHAESLERQAVEDALRHAQKMEAVGQLTGGLAHDFNNLLASVSGSLELLQQRLVQGKTDDLERYIAIGQQATKRAAALTHRMLAFSRRQTLAPKAIGVDSLVDDLKDLIGRTIGPQIDLHVEADPDLWITYVDPNQLENALLNLCINASDAMPGGGTITIRTTNATWDTRAAQTHGLPPGDYICLSVADTGTGMSEQVMTRIFEPFYTTKPMGMGTGLGLSMVYGFARQSGGQVEAESQEGMGTTLRIYLPRDSRTHEPEAAVPPAYSTADPAAGTVLLVDDEMMVRSLVTEVLEDAGYTVLQAEDGASGLAVLQSDQPLDLLITDVGLPGGMNGRQLAEAGRLVRPQLKVLFITGYAESAVVRDGHLETGMQVLTKPFTLTDLGQRIQSLIEG